jgi:hypothetical protein
VDPTGAFHGLRPTVITTGEAIGRLEESGAMLGHIYGTAQTRWSKRGSFCSFFKKKSSPV